MEALRRERLPVQVQLGLSRWPVPSLPPLKTCRTTATPTSSKQLQYLQLKPEARARSTVAAEQSPEQSQAKRKQNRPNKA